jgi:hypothetical protein
MVSEGIDLSLILSLNTVRVGYFIVWYLWPLWFFLLLEGSGNGWIHVFNSSLNRRQECPSKYCLCGLFYSLVLVTPLIFLLLLEGSENGWIHVFNGSLDRQQKLHHVYFIVWYSWPLWFFLLLEGSGNGWIHVFNGGLNRRQETPYRQR